ncbi:hypothetical protein [Nostoc sp. GT001]|nr:hypothetical protein [Nostoc sp. GT001]MDM9583101.1 hypothetical protein [Nostoc sp. GT001]
MRIVYHLNGKSFSNLKDYKEIPLDTLQSMVAIHVEAVESERKAWVRGK